MMHYDHRGKGRSGKESRTYTQGAHLGVLGLLGLIQFSERQGFSKANNRRRVSIGRTSLGLCGDWGDTRY